MIDEERMYNDFDTMRTTYAAMYATGKGHLTEIEEFLIDKGINVTKSAIARDRNSFHFKFAGLNFKLMLEVTLYQNSIAFRNGLLSLYRIKSSDDSGIESLDEALKFEFDKIGNIGHESIQYFKPIFLASLIGYIEKFSERFPLEAKF